MPAPLDPAELPLDMTALRALLLQREAEYAAELQAARAGLQEQVLRNKQLKLRLAKLLRERFGASSEKLRTAIEQLELILGDLEEQIAETAPAEPQQSAAPEPADTARRKPARRPLPENLPRTTVEHAAPCACPKCGGALQSGTIQFDAAARIDLGLAIQRAMIGIFRHQHMCQQRRRGQATVNRQAGGRRLRDAVATPARHTPLLLRVGVIS